MALLMDKDPNTGIELNGMYYRIDKLNFNDYQFQIVVTGYASEQAYIDKMLPISQPRAYTFDYDKSDLESNYIYSYAYNLLKTHEDFKQAINDETVSQ